MIKVCVNGQWLGFEQPPNGKMLLVRLDLLERPLVAELNGAVIDRRAFLETRLADGDQIELVSVVGGG